RQQQGGGQAVIGNISVLGKFILELRNPVALLGWHQRPPTRACAQKGGGTNRRSRLAAGSGRSARPRVRPVVRRRLALLRRPAWRRAVHGVRRSQALSALAAPAPDWKNWRRIA